MFSSIKYMLLTILAIILLGYFYPGHMTIVVPPWTVEMSLSMVLLITMVLFYLVWLLAKILKGLPLPRILWRQRQQRLKQQLQQQLLHRFELRKFHKLAKLPMEHIGDMTLLTQLALDHQQTEAVWPVLKPYLQQPKWQPAVRVCAVKCLIAHGDYHQCLHVLQSNHSEHADQAWLAYCLIKTGDIDGLVSLNTPSKHHPVAIIREYWLLKQHFHEHQQRWQQCHQKGHPLTNLMHGMNLLMHEQALAWQHCSTWARKSPVITCLLPLLDSVDLHKRIRLQQSAHCKANLTTFLLFLQHKRYDACQELLYSLEIDAQDLLTCRLLLSLSERQVPHHEDEVRQFAQLQAERCLAELYSEAEQALLD